MTEDFWSELSKSPLSEHEMRLYEKDLDWEAISVHQKNPIPLDLIDRYLDVMNLNGLFSNQLLPLRLINELSEKVDWKSVSKQPLSFEQIEAYKDYIDLDQLLLFQKLPEEKLVDLINETNASIISGSETPLSESFMDRFEDLLDWFQICFQQTFSFEFALKHVRAGHIREPHLFFICEGNKKLSFTEEENNTLRDEVFKLSVATE